MCRLVPRPACPPRQGPSPRMKRVSGLGRTMVQPAEARQCSVEGLRDFLETLWRGGNRAVMAARPQAGGGTRRAVVAATPPSAATGRPARRANAFQRQGPRAGASGWLGVGKIGERKTRSAPSRRARRRPAAPCAATERKVPGRPARRASRKGSRAEVAGRSGQCSPARQARAGRGAAPRSRTSPRRRPSRAMSPSSAGGRPRATTPPPRGRPAAAARGSGRRAGSLNSHSRGSAAPRRLRPGLSRDAAPSTVRTPWPPSPTI